MAMVIVDIVGARSTATVGVVGAVVTGVVLCGGISVSQGTTCVGSRRVA